MCIHAYMSRYVQVWPPCRLTRCCALQNAASLALQGPLCRGALAALFSLAPSKLEEALGAVLSNRQWDGEGLFTIYAHIHTQHSEAHSTHGLCLPMPITASGPGTAWGMPGMRGQRAGRDAAQCVAAMQHRTLQCSAP